MRGDMKEPWYGKLPGHMLKSSHVVMFGKTRIIPLRRGSAGCQHASAYLLSGA